MNKTKVILNTSYGTGIFFKHTFVKEYLKLNKNDKNLFRIGQVWSSNNNKEKVYRYSGERTNQALISFIEERLEYESTVLASEHNGQAGEFSFFSGNPDSWFMEGFDGKPGIDIVEVENIEHYKIINYDGAECLCPKGIIGKCSILFTLENKEQ